MLDVKCIKYYSIVSDKLVDFLAIFYTGFSTEFTEETSLNLFTDYYSSQFSLRAFARGEQTYADRYLPSGFLQAKQVRLVENIRLTQLNNSLSPAQ